MTHKNHNYNLITTPLPAMFAQRALQRLCSLQCRHGSRLYPELERGAYARITDADMTAFQSIVGDKGVRFLRLGVFVLNQS